MTFAPVVRMLNKNTPSHLYPKQQISEGTTTFMYSLGTPKQSIQWAFDEYKNWSGLGRKVAGFTISRRLAIEMKDVRIDYPNYLYGLPMDVVDDGYNANWIKIHIEPLKDFDGLEEL
jgi:hypothetical protein